MLWGRYYFFKLIKFSAGDLNNIELLNEVKKYNVSIILSTGASNINEIKKTQPIVSARKVVSKAPKIQQKTQIPKKAKKSN